jgi:cell division protein FtsW
MRCQDLFGSVIAIGITTLIAVQAVLNIAVVTGTIPTTGMSLPFFSYGGTALLLLLANVGILLNISRSSSKV